MEERLAKIEDQLDDALTKIEALEAGQYAHYKNDHVEVGGLAKDLDVKVLVMVRQVGIITKSIVDLYKKVHELKERIDKLESHN